MNNTKIIKLIIQNKEPAFAVYSYKNPSYAYLSYKVVFKEAEEKSFLIDGIYKGIPVCLFRNGKLTKDGNDWLKNNA